MSSSQFRRGKRRFAGDRNRSSARRESSNSGLKLSKARNK